MCQALTHIVLYAPICYLHICTIHHVISPNTGFKHSHVNREMSWTLQMTLKSHGILLMPWLFAVTLIKRKYWTHLMPLLCLWGRAHCRWPKQYFSALMIDTRGRVHSHHLSNKCLKWKVWEKILLSSIS